MSLVNSCVVNATTTGTGTFSLGAQALGALTPLLAGANNNAKYTYRAFLPDLSQWEDGIGLYTTQIDPSFRSADNTSPGGFGGNSPLTFNAPPGVANGDLIAGYLGLPVSTGTSPGPLGITGTGWNIDGPALYPQGAYDQYVWFLWKVASSEPASYQVTWANSDGLFQFWLMSAWETGGSTPALVAYNGQGVTSEADSILAQTNLPGGIELRLMCQFNFGGTFSSTTQSSDFISITPYTNNGNQPAFGYALYNNVDSAPAIPNTSGPYNGFSGAAVFTFSGAPDTLSRDLVLKSSSFNKLVNFPSPPIIALTPGAHEASNQEEVIITASSYVVQETDVFLVYRGPSPGLITLLDASERPGRELHFRNETNFVILSNAANVVPAGGGSPSNALLPLNAEGTWVNLKARTDGNWVAELTNAGQFGNIVAYQVYATPVVLPSNDLALIGNSINHNATNPFTFSVNLGAATGPFVVIIVPNAQSSDTVTVGAVTIPFVAASAQGCVFMGRATGLSGSQTLSVNSLTWLETVIGVWVSQFDWVLQAVAGAKNSVSGSIAAAANSVLLGCFDANSASTGAPAPGTISFSGSTALPTSRADANFDGTATGFNGLQTCAAIWDVTNAETFNLVWSSAGQGVNNYWTMCNLTLAPAQPSFRFLVADDLPAVLETPVLTSALPSAATAGAGARAFVTDANAPTFAGTLTGSGTVASPVYSDGTVWRTG